MRAIVKRAEFLQTLELVQPGLSPRDMVEQSACVAFKGGEVMTYNDEISCRAPSPVPNGFTGAVRAKSLVELLRTMTDEIIEVGKANDGSFLIRPRGKSRWAALTLDTEVKMPIDEVERPSKWRPLDPDFPEAAGVVSACAGSDESKFVTCCVHVHPDKLEATDMVQLASYRIKTGVREPVIARHEALKHVAGMGMTEIAETPSWLHFRNPANVVLSCKRIVEKFLDFAKVTPADGTRIAVPKKLEAAAKLAKIFSKENEYKGMVRVTMKPGEMVVRGEGLSGRYHHPIRPFDYNGPEVRFMVPPDTLMELSKRHNEMMICDGNFGGKCFKVVSPRLLYVVSLESVPERAAK
jgi:DNA polymerase III sliding clamp (beta) subunit (PCNA family)